MAMAMPDADGDCRSPHKYHAPAHLCQPPAATLPWWVLQEEVEEGRQQLLPRRLDLD